MNTKSKTYMRGDEFKERQGSFAFYCAAAADFLIAFRDECRKGWRKLFKGDAGRFENITLPLPFGYLTHRKWQKLAIQVTLFPTTKGTTA